MGGPRMMLFEGRSVFNYRHPSPRREEGGLRAAGQVAFRRDWGDWPDTVIEFREVNF